MARGLLKELAAATGKPLSEVKREIMKAAMGAYKKIKAELGVRHLPWDAFAMILRHVVPLTWKIIETEKRIPSADEVYKKVIAEWPTYKEDIAKYLGVAAKA